MSVKSFINYGLGDEDRDVYNIAAWIFGKIGQGVVDPLVSALNDRSKNNNHRENIALTLGYVKSEKAIEALGNILRDTREFVHVRCAAVQALKNIGGEKSKACLHRSFPSGDSWVNNKILEALGNVDG